MPKLLNLYQTSFIHSSLLGAVTYTVLGTGDLTEKETEKVSVLWSL